MNRYTLISQLGDGSFGIVSKASNNTTQEIVAVKKMKQRFITWEECLQLREIQSLRRLQHANIIKLKEVVRENTELYMIFEHMEMNIFQIMRNRSERVGSVQSIFTDKEIRSIMCQTLLGLSAVHKGGFMHRDLKPENLLTKGDVVKIADFGLAKEIRSRPPFTEYVSTRWYRAPEIILRSTHYNSPIDIWALGVIFAELYLNRPLFPGSSDSDQLFKICSIMGAPTSADWDEGLQLARRMNVRFPSLSPTPPRQIIPNAPPAAIDLIEQMLRFNPVERPTCTGCLNHPFFTGKDDAYTTPPPIATLYTGIASGSPQNPYQMGSVVEGGVNLQQHPKPLPNHVAPPPTNNNSSSVGGGYSSYGGSMNSNFGGGGQRSTTGTSPIPGQQPGYGQHRASAMYALPGTSSHNTSGTSGSNMNGPPPGFNRNNGSGSPTMFNSAVSTGGNAPRLPTMGGSAPAQQQQQGGYFSHGQNSHGSGRDDDFLY